MSKIAEEVVSDLVEVLRAIVDQTSVGQHHRPVNTRSAYGNYPAKLYYRARHTLSRATQKPEGGL